MLRLGLLSFALALATALPATRAAAVSLASLRGSIFKIQVVSNEASLTEPWKRLNSQHSSGTGFYIGDGRLLTNAHVVANASFVTILRDGDSAPIPARVTAIGHDCDLALLEPDQSDPAAKKLLADLVPLELGAVPKLRSPVSTIGFPMGGEQLSVTEGIVSRISYHRYVHHGSARHVLVQVDAAINPGNSGGPVIQGRQVVGVAFQTNNAAQSTGYIIPTPVIQRFLRAVAAGGPYLGHPQDGLTTTDLALVNPSTAAFHGLAPEAGGVVVSHVDAWAPTARLIEPGDIIQAIDGQAVGVDGKVNFAGERVDFRTIFDLKLLGESVHFAIIRGGLARMVTVPVRASLPHHETGHVFARHARYFVYGGLVFSSLSRNYLRTWGEKWYRDAPLLLRYLDSYGELDADFAGMRDVLVLVKRLPDPVNTYATANTFGVVRTVDGQAVTSLPELITALEQGKPPYAVIGFYGSDDPLVLARAKVQERNAAINAKYGVTPDRWLGGVADDAATAMNEQAGTAAGGPQ